MPSKILPTLVVLFHSVELLGWKTQSKIKPFYILFQKVDATSREDNKGKPTTTIKENSQYLTVRSSTG